MIEFLGDVVGWFADNWDGQDGYLVRGWNTIRLSGLATLVAAVLAIPLGALIGHYRRFGVSAVAVVNIGRALPSFGIIALALPITIRIARNIPDGVPIFGSGLGFFPAFIALFALALPPIFTNTFTGIREVDPGTVEAARGMGLTEGKILRSVEAPLASPIIIAGLRISAVQVVATSPLAALVAYRGLGRFIVDGFAIRDNVQIFAGAFLVAALAILTELFFSFVARRFVPRALQARGRRTGSSGRRSREVPLPIPP
jgi:osmoprotectant transport system permease protein